MRIVIYPETVRKIHVTSPTTARAAQAVDYVEDDLERVEQAEVDRTAEGAVGELPLVGEHGVFMGAEDGQTLGDERVESGDGLGREAVAGGDRFWPVGRTSPGDKNSGRERIAGAGGVDDVLDGLG